MAKIHFGGVHLLDDVDRMGGVGMAYANTSYFRAGGFPAQPSGPKSQSYVIELDTATGLVTVTAENGGAIVVPRERVKRFEPLPAPKAEDAAPAKK